MAAAAFPVVPKKKTTNSADRLPQSGLTGMGFATKRHFIVVKKRMEDFLDHQEAFEYDGQYPTPPSHHRHHLHPRQHDLLFVDEKKAPKPRSQPHTPVASRKQPTHRGPATPQPVRRGAGKS